jgi:hypothetical protein
MFKSLGGERGIRLPARPPVRARRAQAKSSAGVLGVDDQTQNKRFEVVVATPAVFAKDKLRDFVIVDAMAQFSHECTAGKTRKLFYCPSRTNFDESAERSTENRGLPGEW